MINNLDYDHVREFVRPDLDPNCLQKRCSLIYYNITAVEKVITEIENSLRSACFMKSRLIRNEFLLILGANNLQKTHTQKKETFSSQGYTG